jgi:hypothetical membrane protein
MRLYAIAVGWILLAISIAQALVPAPYDWQRNTVSELAAQAYEMAWIMRAGFIGFGGLLTVGAGQRLMINVKENRPDAFVLLYGMAVFLSGVYSTAPFVEGVFYSEPEVRTHSLMATVAGVAISLGMAGRMITEPAPMRKFFHLAALVLVLILSILFGVLAEGTGIIQRALYLVGFVWLVGSETISLQMRSKSQDGW